MWRAFSWSLGLALFGCGLQQSGRTGIEAESYSILNEIIEDNCLYLDPLCEMPLELEITSQEWLAEFSKEDRDFIKECQDSLGDKPFAAGRLTAWSAKTHDWKPLTLVAEDDSTFYDEISWPVFDRGRTKAVVQFVSSANGLLSGDGRTVLYVKVRGRWKRWRVYDAWIS